MNQNDKKIKGGTLFGMTRTARVGSWTMAMTLIVLAVLIVINLLVGALPGSLTEFDMTQNKKFTLTKTTQNFVKNIDRDVELIVVSESASIEATMQNFIDRYTALNSRIRFRIVDPVADPTFLDQYTEIAGTGRYIIVQSDLRYQLLDTMNLETVYIHDMQQSMPLYQYEQVMADDTTVQFYAQYYQIDLSNVTYYFNGEQMITAAIEYVVAEEIPHLYLYTGNDGAVAFSSTMDEILSTVMLDYDLLSLQIGDTVPADASCVIINAPAFDLTDAAYTALSDYVAGGGNLMLITKPENTSMPNLMRLAKAFGVQGTTGGVLHEGNANRYVGASHVLLPAINNQDPLLGQAQSQNLTMIMPNAHGILIDETLPADVSVSVMFAAADAYTKAADGSETDYGAVPTGVQAQNTKTGARFAWYASAEAFSDASATAYGPGAFYYFALYADLFNDGYASTLTAIESMEMSTQMLSVSLLALEIVAVILAAVPVALLVVGIVIWVRRRRR